MGKEWHSFGSGRFGRRAEWRTVPRPGLLRRIDAADGLVVLVGGSGAGKSTLLDAWVAGNGGRLVTGAELGRDDDGAGLFAADELGRVGGGALAVDGLPDPGWLDGIGRRPLVVAAERDPQLAGAVVIGAGELAFAEDETYQVLAAVLGDAEAADGLAPDLHLLTNGWPALVALAGAWLGQFAAGDRAARLRGLARVDAGLAEHLGPLVVAGLGEAERELLRRMVWLPAVDAATADRLDLSEDLHGVAPFVQGLARRAGWFAVPHGWVEMLRRELPLSAGEVAALRAAYVDGL